MSSDNVCPGCRKPTDRTPKGISASSLGPPIWVCNACGVSRSSITSFRAYSFVDTNVSSRSFHSLSSISMYDDMFIIGDRVERYTASRTIENVVGIENIAGIE